MVYPYWNGQSTIEGFARCLSVFVETHAKQNTSDGMCAYKMLFVGYLSCLYAAQLLEHDHCL